MTHNSEQHLAKVSWCLGVKKYEVKFLKLNLPGVYTTVINLYLSPNKAQFADGLQ